MFNLVEIYNYNITNNLQFVFDLVRITQPADPKLRLKNAIDILINFKLFNKIETDIIKANYDKFVNVMNSYKNLDDILVLLTDNDRNNMSNEIEIIRNNYKNIYDMSNMSGITGFNSTMGIDTSLNIEGEKIIYNLYSIKVLGEGSFGIVYLALDKDNNEKVVVKKIKQLNGNEKEEFDNLDILKDECSLYFVCVLKYLDTKDFKYIVMEYLENYVVLEDKMKDIYKLFSAGGDLKIPVNIMGNICNAIKYMHAKGVAHNDIKPENIMVNYSTGDIKFIDFGLSCKNEQCALQVGKGVSGTYYYLDPYLVRKNISGSNISSGERANGDLFSYGIIIYKMVTNTIPFLFYTNSNEYFTTYDYFIDKNKDKIEGILNKINLSLTGLLTMDSLSRKLPCS